VLKGVQPYREEPGDQQGDFLKGEEGLRHATLRQIVED
jgi:hypothetical protein